jgi:hypothetical protein
MDNVQVVARASMTLARGGCSGGSSRLPNAEHASMTGGMHTCGVQWWHVKLTNLAF